MIAFIKTRIVPYLIYSVYKIYFFTIKVVEDKLPNIIKEHEAENRNYIVAHFHQDELMLVNTRSNSGFVVMTSLSVDGRMMQKFLELMGYKCIQGSSSKGGDTALVSMVHLLNSTNNKAVIAVDGPRGPIYKVKHGVLMLSKLSGAPILPVVATAERAFIFKSSWNKAILPKPFSTVRIQFGKPIIIPSNTEKDAFIEYGNKLETELLTIKGYL